jgi:2-polyprenyl-6-methoxyphenol hydroxylase-like FAD-dependent oxidoreductase
VPAARTTAAHTSPPRGGTPDPLEPAGGDGPLGRPGARRRPIGTGTGIATLRQTPAGVEVDGGPVDAIVVADGAHSGIRAALFPDHPGLRGSCETAARAISPRPDVPLVAGELLERRTGERSAACR